MNRFDLEQNILKCWNVTEDIDLLYRRIMDGPDMSKDEIANYLLGMSTIYNAKFDETFNQFEVMVLRKEI